MILRKNTSANNFFAAMELQFLLHICFNMNCQKAQELKNNQTNKDIISKRNTSYKEKRSKKTAKRKRETKTSKEAINFSKQKTEQKSIEMQNEP